VQYTVGISELRATDQRGDVLVTYSLGSCIGLTLYDPAAGVGGMVHCMLPLSRINPAKAGQNPAMFVDTGVPALLEKLFALGAERERLVANVAGAATLLDERKLFRIGERNHTILRKTLWRNDILIAGADVGGTVARTMCLRMSTGQTTIRSGGREVPL